MWLSFPCRRCHRQAIWLKESPRLVLKQLSVNFTSREKKVQNWLCKWQKIDGNWKIGDATYQIFYSLLKDKDPFTPVATIAPWFRLHLPSCSPGLNPKHTIYAFFNLYYWNCIEKITKINKKRPGLAHFFNIDYWWCFSWRLNKQTWWEKKYGLTKKIWFDIKNWCVKKECELEHFRGWMNKRIKALPR